jgi:hypothetical protein
MDDYELIAESKALYLDACALAKIDVEEDLDSNLIRFLVYQPKIPVFSSFVGFGEFFNVVGKKETQKKMGVDGYLFSCRQLMIDFDYRTIKRAEPVGDRFKFLQLAQELLPKHGHLGGGDLWHLMAAIELKRDYPSVILLTFEAALIKAARSEGIGAVDCKGLNSHTMANHFGNLEP